MKSILSEIKRIEKKIEQRKRTIIKEHKNVLKELNKKETEKYCKLQLKDELDNDYETDLLREKFKTLKRCHKFFKDEIKNAIKKANYRRYEGNLKIKKYTINQFQKILRSLG